MISRRRFLAAAGVPVWPWGAWREVAPEILRPGMDEGHRLRDGAALPPARGERTTGVVILGSGVAGLMTAWRLAREGRRDFVLVSGPEPGGNASAGERDGVACPRGAHYLPLPSIESTHVRALLAELSVIERGADDTRPLFDEAALVHSPEERLLVDGRWHEGLMPPPASAQEVDEQRRFLAAVARLRIQRGSDGRRVFTVPLALASGDPQWTALDRLSFARWLDAEGYRGKALRWYLDYCCRDDYGAPADAVSAWAGLHYFASRDGHAANAQDGAVLTWPDGLHRLMAGMTQAITRRMGDDASWHMPGVAVRVDVKGAGVVAQCLDVRRGEAFTLRARRAVCAMPLYVAARVVPVLHELGYDPRRHAPGWTPWLVANHVLEGFPREAPGAPLAWDNVVYGSTSLGYVVATHQQIRAARPARTVFTTYAAVAESTPDAARRWLADAAPDGLCARALVDLEAAYGRRLRPHLRAMEITVRGHAMASPRPGFLSNPGLSALRDADGPILFAHSDLSGMSLFEEAAWWGDQAARRILGT